MVSQRERVLQNAEVWTLSWFHKERECYKMLRSGHCHGFTKRERERERESVLQNAEVWTLSWFHKERERVCYKMLRSGHCHGFTKRERECVTKC